MKAYHLTSHVTNAICANEGVSLIEGKRKDQMLMCKSSLSQGRVLGKFNLP